MSTARYLGAAATPDAGRTAPRACRICGRDFPPRYYFTRGRCQMCANYWLRHGEERPPLPPGQLQRTRQRQRSGPQACIHCGRLAEQRGRGRCMACYQYWRRHGGVERPLQPRSARPPRLCMHCGQPTTRPVRGRCPTCFAYWRRRGIERPLGVRTARACRTCGRLAQGLRRGRCPVCYMYWYRHGRERPAELWQR